MRAVVLKGFGGLEMLEERDLPVPEPGPGQVQRRRIEVEIARQRVRGKARDDHFRSRIDVDRLAVDAARTVCPVGIVADPPLAAIGPAGKQLVAGFGEVGLPSAAPD